MNSRAELKDWIETPSDHQDGNAGLDRSASQRLRPLQGVKTNAIPELSSGNEDAILSNSQGDLEALDVLLSRYRSVLSLVAYRVLGNHEEAEDAVENCLLAVSANVPRLEHERAFRNWLVRVLIDEAGRFSASEGTDQREPADLFASIPSRGRALASRD
jgi:hypothetical protein